MIPLLRESAKSILSKLQSKLYKFVDGMALAPLMGEKQIVLSALPKVSERN
jgi:hypothetical protein